MHPYTFRKHSSPGCLFCRAHFRQRIGVMASDSTGLYWCYQVRSLSHLSSWALPSPCAVLFASIICNPGACAPTQPALAVLDVPHHVALYTPTVWVRCPKTHRSEQSRVPARPSRNRTRSPFRRAANARPSGEAEKRRIARAPGACIHAILAILRCPFP